MMNKAAFILLLAVILLLGYYSVDIAELLVDISDSEQAKIARDAGTSGAIYISSERDIDFDPMSILEPSNNNSDPSDESDSQYYDDLILCEEMLLHMSRYCKEAEFDEPNAAPIYKNLKISGNGYAYLDRCEYYNTVGELRCLDCIISLEDHSVVYIRFYAPDEEMPEADDINLAVNEFGRYSAELYSFREGLSNIIEKIYSTYWLYRVESEFSGEISKEFLDTEFATAFDITYEVVDTASPVLCFWFDTMSVSLVEFERDEAVSSVLGTSYVIRKLASEYTVSAPTYSVRNGSIYQTVYLKECRLVTIYNIRGGYVEGFYAEPID